MGKYIFFVLSFLDFKEDNFTKSMKIYRNSIELLLIDITFYRVHVQYRECFRTLSFLV